MAKEIADQVGRSVQTTRLRIHRLGLKKIFRYDECHRVVNGAKEKLCRKCREWKAENQFYKNGSSKDGLVGWCKKCLSSACKKWRLAVKS